MATVQVGVQAPPGSTGQGVDFDEPYVNLTSVQNIGSGAVAISTDGGASWTAVSAGATVAVGVSWLSANLVRLRNSAGGYPNAVVLTFDPIDEGALAAAQLAAVAKITYRRAGNLTTGVGADLVFSGAGGAGSGKLNTGIDLLIPANTIIAGQSMLKVLVHVRRTGTDASFIDVRFGATNGTGDGVMLAATQFSSGANPGDICMEIVSSATSGRLTSAGQISNVNVAATGVTITDLASLNFAVDNYVTVVVSGCTTGSYRVVSCELQVFQ